MNFTPSDLAFANTSFFSGVSAIIESPFKLENFCKVLVQKQFGILVAVLHLISAPKCQAIHVQVQS
jgi:hypothetical protein